jgi:dUTP pyrophosphatase
MHLQLKLDEDMDVIIQEYYLSKNSTGRDSGFDLVSPIDILINPGETAKINFKIKCSLINNDDTIAYYLYPRSSISKTPLRMANSVGIIDRDYRGNIMAVVDNIKDEPYQINKGDRLFQICSPTLESFDIHIVDTLDETERGEGGFGSTGSNI